MKTNREEILQNALQLFMAMNYESVSLPNDFALASG